MQIDAIRERLPRLETSCLCDAKKTLRCLDPAIQPLSCGVKLVGRAFTVACCNDFLTVIKALQDASPGDVLVIDGQQGRKALAGELFSTEAKRKGLAGIVVDGVFALAGFLTLPLSQNPGLGLDVNVLGMFNMGFQAFWAGNLLCAV